MITSPDYEAYKAKLAVAEALEAEVVPLNKAAIFEALASSDIQTVTVGFDGYGDSGQIESMIACDEAGIECELSNTPVQYQEVSFQDAAITTQSVPLHEAIARLVFALLEQTHAGWENNEGAFGEFAFNVPSRSIALNYNERFVESTYYQHEF